jgi:hypothetical protein
MSMKKINESLCKADMRYRQYKLDNAPKYVRRRRLKGSLDWSVFEKATTEEERVIAKKEILEQYKREYGFTFSPLYPEVTA